MLLGLASALNPYITSLNDMVSPSCNSQDESMASASALLTFIYENLYSY